MFTEKMEQFGYHHLIDSDLANFDVAKEISNIVEYKLPCEYLQLLIEFPVTVCFDKEVVCAGIEISPGVPDGMYQVSKFFGYCSLNTQNLVYKRQYPPGERDFGPEFLVIGESFPGNYICLKLDGENAGSVYYWEHDHDVEDQCLFLLAESFTYFIERLQEVLVTDVETTSKLSWRQLWWKIFPPKIFRKKRS